jgi:hypothetical protein
MPSRPEIKKQPEETLSPLTLLTSRKRGTKRDVAREHKVSVRTVDTWIAQKKIPYQKLSSRMVRFDLDAVARALNRYTVKEIS